MPDFIVTGPADADLTILLAHGAGAPMDSPWLEAMAGQLSTRNIRTARFEFAYMAARRSGQRKPPPRAETLIAEYCGAVEMLAATGRLIIGGKSMGGRVASMIAGEFFRDRKIAGLVCLGYPFHPPGSPEKLRTAHLANLDCPTLICQGMRDPFGTKEEVDTYRLSSRIAVHWLADGDHDFKPRKASGLTLEANIADAAGQIVAWAAKL